MEFVKCSKGHFYDPSVTSTCPQCAAEEQGTIGVFLGNDYGATEPVSPVENYGATEPLYPGDSAFMGSGDIGLTMPPKQGNGFVPTDFGMRGKVEDYDDATQPTITGGIAGFTPVTGWLVCIDGPAKGTDYRVRAGYNYIGRAKHMDICISGDNQIGHERHAMIAYDQEEKVFFFGPADGKSIVRLNGKMVMVPSEVHAYDIITIGSTKLMFVPLCGERFSWDE